MSNERIRVNIFVTEQMHKWYKAEGKKLGLSMSQVMALALRENMIKKGVILDE